MTQQYLGQITDTAQESGDDLAARLNAFDTAHKTNQSGTTRPGGIQAGGIWSRDLGSGVYALMLYDGTGDRLIGYSGLSPAANRLPYFTGQTAMALTTLSAFGRSLIDDANADAALDTLGASAAGAAALRGEMAPAYSGNRDFNTLLEPGVHTITGVWENNPLETTSNLTAVLDVKLRAFSGGPRVVQTFYLGPTVPEIWHRHGTGDPVTWGPWQRIADREYVDSRGLGAGQTWVDVSGSRNGYTSYQNTTGRTIMVVYSGTVSESSVRFFQVSESGGVWDDVAAVHPTSTTASTFLVPPGWYYRLNATTAVKTWMELR